jgi:hypothetical protein
MPAIVGAVSAIEALSRRLEAAVSRPGGGPIVVPSATGTPVPTRNVSEGGSSRRTEASGPAPLRSAASAITTAGDSATAVVRALRRCLRRPPHA